MNVVFVPGLLCDKAVWQPQLKALHDLAQMQVADHGELDSLGAMADAILARAPPKFAVVGNSMGRPCRARSRAARRQPRDRTCAAGHGGYTPLPPARRARRRRPGAHELLDLARTAGMRKVGERWLSIPMIHPERLKDRTLVESILRMFERRTPAQFAAQIRALLQRPDATALLPMISCPALVLCGQDDAWSTLSTHRVMAQLIPHSTLVSVPECGHMAPMERPEPVSAALRTWLGRVAQLSG